MKKLVGDIGGTNTRIAIAENNKLLITKNFKTKQTDTISAIKKILTKDTKKIILACAGPIKNNICFSDKNYININGKEIEKITGLTTKLINDFEAIAKGLSLLEQNDYITLKKGIETGITLIIGPGTGLGVSIIKNKQTKATELGHTKYSPLKKYEETKKIIKQFRKKEFLEMEDYVSGEGIENLYNYYKQKELSADKIARKRNICKSAKKTFEAFFELYADVILKLIKKTNANRVILVGNITNQYLEDLEKRSFLKNFDNYKGSIKVVKRLDVGLLGATKI